MKCPSSPTGAHHRIMEWRDMPDGTREYWGVCMWCGHPKQEDSTLGMGRVDKIGKRIRGQTVMVAGSHIHCMTDEEYTERTGRKRGREQ